LRLLFFSKNQKEKVCGFKSTHHLNGGLKDKPPQKTVLTVYLLNITSKLLSNLSVSV